MKTYKGFTLIEGLVLIAIIAILAGLIISFVRACKAERPKVETPVTDQTLISQGKVAEIEIKGHRYLLLKSYSDSIIHAEHCPCKTNRVVME